MKCSSKHNSIFNLLIILTAGCAVPDSAPTLSAGSMEPFREEAVARGVAYVMQAYPQASGYVGFGCGFADLDDDGDPDIVIIGAASGRVGLFENDGAGHFTDRSEGSGIPLLAQGSGFAASDFDGDGDLDLYFTQLGEGNVLARNEGNFRFADVTAQAGVADVGGAGKGVSFGDFDGDGWLDLYVCNYSFTNIVRGTSDNKNVLYRNLGNGTFEDVSVAQGVDDHGYGFQSVWFDYDRDGDVDLYLSNDRAVLPPLFRGNQLWRNDGGRLVNVSESSAAGLSLYSMGVACGDFDGNGWPDLYCTNVGTYEEGIYPLLLNQGDGTFVESSAAAGVEHHRGIGWGTLFSDLDNNGHQDLYVNDMFEPNSLFMCDGEFPCVESSEAAEVTASSEPSFGSAVADVDNDGDLDLLVNNLGGNVELFINQEGHKRNWIKYRILGFGHNLFAVGATIETRVGDSLYFREILAGGNGYLGQNELIVHVGLDDATLVDEVVVTWPGGKTARTLTNLSVNRTWTISREGESSGLVNSAPDDATDSVAGPSSLCGSGASGMLVSMLLGLTLLGLSRMRVRRFKRGR